MFQSDLTTFGHPAEHLVAALFRAMEVSVEMNDATDYESLKSHDLTVGGEMWDVKFDVFSGTTYRIFVEAESLKHTKSHRFVYLIPTIYGFDVRVFTTAKLIDLYNAKVKVKRGDGTFAEQWVYEHKVAGDQAGNMGCFIPLDVVKKESIPPYLAAKELRTQMQ
jgi:hypothetical protein